MKTSKQVAGHYTWGANCDGWRLLDRPDLSVIHEKMPADTTETKHYHTKARQFFFILAGQATLEIEGEIVDLGSGEGVEVKAGAKHRIFNQSSDAVEFLVISQPTTQGDRVNLDS